MRLALYQGPSPAGRIEAALDIVAGQLRTASAAGAAVLVMPELFLPGYNQPDRFAALAQPLDGPWMARLADLARGAGCALVLGWAETAEGRLYNAASAIGADGRLLAHYRKVQLYGAMERACFTAGDAPPPVFDLAGRQTSLLICYDIEFPRHAERLGRLGVELLLVPTANPAGFDHVPRVLVPARAHDNRMIVAYANLCGVEGDLAYGGGSVVAGPDGTALATAGAHEALLICTLPAMGDWPQDRLSTS